MKQYVTVQIANDSRATCDVIDVTESQLTCHPDNIPVGIHAVTVSQSPKPISHLDSLTCDLCSTGSDSCFWEYHPSSVTLGVFLL